mmetsp:Transcript_25895/g.40196  ORF Transcript_25895/g.40196 Transcript_25895/m.40196 type:complete len:265 (-) Transcript_25895:207-1001(-)|eukprot:CAMPEP_0196816030 /NCGR_PEP_ID=MMETSP1362-20130617/53167_1 /TAXON_ID=163516 /ORGANISM="Leptocylindrus danicus, Strain CCMP1856" /LENGTH=264 /DNA_ID=CAMNT_0042193217 /DNA_START=32 /DNA_END=826 /DNA_ORIENTATION=+
MNAQMLLTITALTIGSVYGFANPTEKGWKSRPAIPEIQQQSSSTPPSERTPWDAGRFIKQSSKFINVNPFQPKPVTVVVQPGDVIWSAGGVNNKFSWSPLDDVVMGGASESNFDANTGIWSGTVTSANNGGFVGIRTSPSFALDMEQCQGIELKLKGGNGRRFKFIVRDSTDFNGVCWTSSFDAPQSGGRMFNIGFVGGKDSAKIPFSKQVPTIFARTVPDQTFDLKNVVAFQLAYSMFEYDGDLNPNFELGDFSLQVMEMKVY